MIENNIKKAVELYIKKKTTYTDINKKIINNSNTIIKGIELIKSLIDYYNFRIP